MGGPPPGGNGGFHEPGHNDGHDHGHFHGHSSAGIFFSVPLGAPWYYGAAPSYYYSYPPLAVAPATPPVYIWPGSEQPQNGYWYYCGAPQGYYPYIQQCNMVWQQVPAQPPAQ